MMMAHRGRHVLVGVFLTSSLALTATFASCTDSYRSGETGGPGSGPGGNAGAGGTGGEGGTIFNDGSMCEITCSNDLKKVINCYGTILQECTPEEGCANAECIPGPCTAAEISKSSYGCDYWALKTALRGAADAACFAGIVANTWSKPVHITVERGGLPLPVEDFAYIPQGQGQIGDINYIPYDPVAGLQVGEVAVLFLSRHTSGGGNVVDCPVPGALDEETGVVGTGVGRSFHITTDYPVVAYQMVPYGGGQASVTSATLLLPTSAWDTNYIAVNAYGFSEIGTEDGFPSLQIVANQNDTNVTILPKTAIVGNPPEVPASPANTPVTYTLQAGEFLQLLQTEELTGSPIQSDKPVGFFGGHSCMRVPQSLNNCDSAQQQIAPVRALGNEYVAVRHKNRTATEETPPWRLVGAVDGTTLTWDPGPPAGAPESLALGQVVEFSASGPFVVRSQDQNHPFYLGSYMTGGQPFGTIGDPEWINVIPPSQFLNNYVFFTDPTYPETSLVVVRTPSKVDGSFADVDLDCAGPLGGWQSIGGYEYTYVDLMTGMFQSVGNCANGRHEISSTNPFGVYVWGWGAIQQSFNVSYAYPAGAGFQPINEVVVPPEPE